MPKTDKSGKARKDELPSTIQRSDKKAQQTFAKAHDSAEKTYHDEERAHRVAYSALKHSHEKVGDHWEAKDEKGPSDEQAKGGKTTRRETHGGVDANASKQHLYDLAKKLDVPGRSHMTKGQLVDALEKANNRKTAQSRKK
ncbi:ChaB family protein [Sinomonas notoginsengisoli]|uniref:ChaB family protein n=1 Tax=Sinomonas notoginsengisoli TaxID=1457311 RepID=UPI001F400C4D|nr:ChaB family protein [Sinomonas notoginsengisoli]